MTHVTCTCLLYTWRFGFSLFPLLFPLAIIFFFQISLQFSRESGDNSSDPQTEEGSQDMANGGCFSKTICSICYEDLKPIVEDLQAISICGHVFHELCLQQWFEYCSSTNKQTCPVCKQKCSGHQANRLYFQSLGDSNDTVLSQKVTERGEDPEALRSEVKRLEVKVLGLTSAVEQQENDLKERNEELCLCRKEIKTEVALKNEALKQRISIQQLLHLKSEALDQSTLECMRLQERNMALAKELAAFKLISDLNLEEDEVLKFASFGNETKANSKDTVDVLRRSLVTRNKSYKELMAKCNLLGRGEARYCRKLEKAKEKIGKLKTRVQELETVVESRDNEVLRALKKSKKSHEGNVNSDSFCMPDVSQQNQSGKHSLPGADKTESLINNSRKTENSTFVKDTAVIPYEKAAHGQSLDEDDAELSIIEDPSKFFKVASNSDPKFNINEDIVGQKSNQLGPDAASSKEKEVAGLHASSKLVCPFGSSDDYDTNRNQIRAAAVDENVTFIPDSITQTQPVLNIRKETSSATLELPSPGDICFSGGLLGPDGTNRYLGKWCKRGQNKRSADLSMGKSDLITVGADGRGGRVKVLRSINQSSTYADKESSSSARKLKCVAKTSNRQSQGCLQIEHFFGRAAQ